MLSNFNDTLNIDVSSGAPQLFPKQNLPSAASNSQIQSISIKVPVIVLISNFIDESKIKKADNVFVIKNSIEARVIKKILVFL